MSKILYLRQHYHFGPGKIADYLKRFHQLTVAVSSVRRILRQHGMDRLPANQKHRSHAKRWCRYEKSQPGHRLRVDVKFLERIPGTRKRFYHFTVIDNGTRVRVLKMCDACHRHRRPIHRRNVAAPPIPRPCRADAAFRRSTPKQVNAKGARQ